MLKDVTTHRIHKSNQACFLLPWEAPRDNCPYTHNYTRVGIPRKDHKKGTLVDILTVRLDNLRKMVNNTDLPRGVWITIS